MMKRTTKNWASVVTVFLAGTFAAPAFAYVGPGAGLSLLGALWGLVAAVGIALLFVVAWPVRKMLRRKRPAASRQPEEAVEPDPGAAAGRSS